MLKVAGLQHAYKGSSQDTTEYIRNQVLTLGKQGVDLVVLQELHNHAYFCQYEDPKYFALAEHFASHQNVLSQIAKEASVVIVGSLFEKRLEGVYHNTAVVFDSDGSKAGIYRKMHIPDDPNFYEKYYFAPGDLGFNPIKTSIGNLGVLICWDQWFPEAARSMALAGADLLIYPTAIGWSDELDDQERQSSKNAWIGVQVGHSIANHLPVVSINRVGFEADESGMSKGIQFWGHSFMTNARGELIAQSSDQEDIICATIDLEQTKNLRQVWPYFRDRRIEHYDALQHLSRG